MSSPYLKAVELVHRVVDTEDTPSTALVLGRLLEEIKRQPSQEIRLKHAHVLSYDNVLVLTLCNDHRADDLQFELSYAILCTKAGLSTLVAMLRSHIAQLM